MNIELPVFARLGVARMQWQSALVVARRSGGKDKKAMAALQRAEREFRTAHDAAQAWRPLPEPAAPKFKRMPIADPYAIPGPEVAA